MSRIAFYALALCVFALDQATKHALTRAFLPGQSVDILPVLALTYVQNTGGAFGILQSGTLVLAAVALLAAAAIIAWTVRTPAPLPRMMAAALALPLGGALGNFADRVRLHFVVDFVDAHIGPHHFAVFNVADSAICIGVALLAWRFSRPASAPIIEKHS